MKLCCVGCGRGFSITIGGSDHVVTDSVGREWRFENHHYCGPIILRKDGAPKARQPGSRSKFWPAWQAWHDAQQSKNQPQSV